MSSRTAIRMRVPIRAVLARTTLLGTASAGQEYGLAHRAPNGTMHHVTRLDHIGPYRSAHREDQPAASPERAVVLRAAVQRAPRTMRNDTTMASTAVNELGPMLTASEVAEMLHLHVNTVKRLGDRGELPFYRVCKRGDRRFRLEDVMKFLSRNR